MKVNRNLHSYSSGHRWWSGGAMVLGKLPVSRRPTIFITVGQGPIVLAVGAGGGCLDIFTLIYPFSPLSPSLWETVRYRLKYCLKGPLNPKQPTNQPIKWTFQSCFSIPRSSEKRHLPFCLRGLTLTKTSFSAGQSSALSLDPSILTVFI